MVSISEELLELEQISKLGQRHIAVVHEHWKALRGERAMPGRREIDPFALKSALGLIIIAQHEPDVDDFRFTLFGTMIAQAMGRDYTGRLASELTPESYAAAVLASYRTVRGSGKPRLTRLTIGPANSVMVYHRLLLPLGADGKTADALLIVSDNERHFWRILSA
ncbi:MAG: PAS domain-containing protein [Kiloniellales bacterium]